MNDDSWQKQDNARRAASWKIIEDRENGELMLHTIVMIARMTYSCEATAMTLKSKVKREGMRACIRNYKIAQVVKQKPE